MQLYFSHLVRATRFTDRMTPESDIVYPTNSMSGRAKFVELAEKRVSNTIKDIRLISNLSNKGNYSYGEDDVKKIYAALLDEIKKMKSRFEAGGVETKPTFKL